MRVSDDQGLSETFHMETAIDPCFGNSDSYRCTYLLTPFSGDAQGSSGSHSAIAQHHGQLMRVPDNQTLGETFHMETAIDPWLRLAAIATSDTYIQGLLRRCQRLQRNILSHHAGPPAIDACSRQPDAGETFHMETAIDPWLRLAAIATADTNIQGLLRRCQRLQRSILSHHSGPPAINACSRQPDAG